MNGAGRAVDATDSRRTETERLLATSRYPLCARPFMRIADLPSAIAICPPLCEHHQAVLDIRAELREASYRWHLPPSKKRTAHETAWRAAGGAEAARGAVGGARSRHPTATSEGARAERDRRMLIAVALVGWVSLVALVTATCRVAAAGDGKLTQHPDGTWDDASAPMRDSTAHSSSESLDGQQLTATAVHAAPTASSDPALERAGAGVGTPSLVSPRRRLGRRPRTQALSR